MNGKMQFCGWEVDDSEWIIEPCDQWGPALTQTAQLAARLDTSMEQTRNTLQHNEQQKRHSE